MRRTFRRHIRKTLSQNVPPVLQEANFAFDKGEYGRAAVLYENIAHTTDARGGPRAPLFHLRAGRARVYAGQTRLGLPSLRRGLELLAQRGQVHKLHQTGNQILAELNERGLTEEAGEVESWLRHVSPNLADAESGPAPIPRPVPPARCSACGAGIQPDEVEWLDDVTAVCAYCGSPIR